ncbi:hypothetical protein [Halocynthiibacter namhaensis]|uniref:hypothetical protein n=1 Tax=Halocynthiibacter namhaensis TaxID=1290553 RepID=UPI000578EE53|nr:hypothetical protein [Halocynthiibacter namhaensis]
MSGKQTNPGYVLRQVSGLEKRHTIAVHFSTLLETHHLSQIFHLQIIRGLSEIQILPLVSLIWGAF